MGILPMSEGLTHAHGQDARATAGIQRPPSIGRCARPRSADLDLSAGGVMTNENEERARGKPTGPPPKFSNSADRSRHRGRFGHRFFRGFRSWSRMFKYHPDIFDHGWARMYTDGSGPQSVSIREIRGFNCRFRDSSASSAASCKIRCRLVWWRLRRARASGSKCVFWDNLVCARRTQCPSDCIGLHPIA